MHLLNLLLIELVQHPVILLFVARLIILYPLDVHRIVKYQETTFQLESPNLRQIQKCFFHIFQLQIFHSAKKRLRTRFQLIQEFHHRELHGRLLRCGFLTLSLLHQLIQPLHGKTTDFQPFLKPFDSGLQVCPASKLHVTCSVFLLVRIPFYGKKIQQRADVLFFRRDNSVVHRIVVQLLARNPQRLIRDMAENILFQFRKTLQQHPRLPFRVARILQIGRNILTVGQYTLLPHPLYHRHHFLLGQSQNIGQVINPRFRSRVLRLGNVLLRNQGRNDSHRLLYLVSTKQHRCRDTLPCLVHVLYRDTGGIHMRHIVSPLQVTALLQCRQSRPHTCLNIRHRVIPSRIPGNLQRRTAHPHAFPRHILYRLPHLLDFTDTQLRLIQQNKMLIQVIVTVKHVTACVKMRVTSGPAGFLHIVLQRIGNIVMHHQSHILLVYSHSESRRRHDDAHLVAHERILVGNLLVGIHLSVERQRLIAVARQFRSQFLGTPCTRHVHNGRTAGLCYQLPQLGILILIRLGMHHRIVQIRSRSRRSKQLQIQVQRPLEIITNILYHLLFGRCRETGYRYRVTASLLLLILLNKLADIQIIHPEVLPPGRKTMRLINNESYHVAHHQNPLDGFRTQHFRGDIQQGSIPLLYPLNGKRPRNRVQQSVDGHGIRNSLVSQIVHLVLHERLQRRNDHRKSMHRPCLHKCRKLECQRFSSPCRKNSQQGLPLYRRSGCPFLKRFTPIGTELVIAKESFQVTQYIQLAIAIGTAFRAACTSQQFHHIFHFRIIAKHPSGRHRTMVSRIDQCQRISQLTRITLN